MAICPKCASEVPGDQPLCPVCGELMITRTAPEKEDDALSPFEMVETAGEAERATPSAQEPAPAPEAPAEAGAPQFHPVFAALPAPAEESSAAKEENFRVPLTVEQLPAAWKPMGAWKFFGYALLFAIPVIGWFALLVCALGGAENLNLRGFARMYFCWLLVAVLLCGIGAAVLYFCRLSIDPAGWYRTVLDWLPR